MNKIRIILYQKPLGIRITRQDASIMRSFKPHFVCFPEYFFVNRALGNHKQTPHNFHRQVTRIKIISQSLDTVVIGGSTPEPVDGKLFNTSFVYHSGKPLGFYRKQNLFFAEKGVISPGHTLTVFSAFGINFGVLICADVFLDQMFLKMKEMGAEIIFIPTFSPFKEETVEEKFKRDREIYVRGARLSGALIVKVCGVKSEYIDFIQARSLVADRTGVLIRTSPEEEDKPMIIKYEAAL